MTLGFGAGLQSGLFVDLVEGFLSSPAVLLLGLTKRLSVVGLPVDFPVGALVDLLVVLLVEGVVALLLEISNSNNNNSSSISIIDNKK